LSCFVTHKNTHKMWWTMWIKHQPPPHSHTPKIEYISVPSVMYDCIRTEHVSLVDPRHTSTPTLPNSATTRPTTTTTTTTTTRASTTTTTASTTKINASPTTNSMTTAVESQERDDYDIQYRRPTTTATATVVPVGVQLIAIAPQPATNPDSVIIMSSAFFNDNDENRSWTWSEDLNLDHRNRPSNERLLVRCLLFCVRGQMFSSSLFHQYCSPLLTHPFIPYNTANYFLWWFGVVVCLFSYCWIMGQTNKQKTNKHKKNNTYPTH
jgi:hypothetical protein